MQSAPGSGRCTAWPGLASRAADSPAEDNVLRVHAGHAAGQFQGVAGDVAVGHHRVVLIMMAHDAEPVAQLFLKRRHGGGDVVHGVIRY